MTRRLAMFAAALALAACEGVPVRLGTPVKDSAPQGTAREITAESCGFQLLLLIPIAINDRQGRAYRQLEKLAFGDFITDVRVQERWTYAFVGTIYCTSIQAKAVRSSA